MPPPPVHPSLRHLSLDPISGIPYYYHNSNDTLAAAARPTVLLNPPLIEIPSNMLGARARAAEYNAAKAATARQQATRESEEKEQRLPPRPTPVSLSAFARNASYSRNRGTKNFVPLVLSQEEDQTSTSSTEHIASERDQSNSPPTDLLLRPASLPPPQSTLYNSVAMENTTRTPLRFTSPRLQMQPYSVTPRLMQNEEDYGFPVAGMAYPTHHFVPYQPARSYAPQHGLLANPQIGWYTPPPPYYGTHCSYPDAGVVPMPSFTETRPRLTPNVSRESTTMNESITESPSKPSKSSKPPAKDSRPATPKLKLGGPTVHYFGPDDLSPTKMEIKQKAREEYFARTPVRHETPRMSSAESESVSKQHLINGASSKSDETRDLLVDHGGMAQASVQGSSASIRSFPKPNIPTRNRSIESYGNTDNSRAGPDDTGTYRQNAAFDGSPVHRVGTRRYERPDQEFSRTFADSNSAERGARMFEEDQKRRSSFNFDAKQEQQAAVRLAKLRHEQEQSFVVARLLTYPQDPDWWNISGSVAEERERIMMLKRAISSKSESIGESMRVSAIKQEDVRLQYQQSMGEYEQRMRHVRDLADEMKHKWEYGEQFRGPAMTKKEAKKHAGIVEDIGHMVAVLGILSDGRNNHLGLGSRPYIQPPEYAIERSVSTDKERSVSLFEQEGEEIRPAPPRLARDPRFRAQMNEGMSTRGDNDRIPRMFVSRGRE